MSTKSPQRYNTNLTMKTGANPFDSDSDEEVLRDQQWTMTRD